jgi:hypothetical protein
MKKLKCEECGGHLTIDEKGEYATCEYCNTKYKLNDNQTIVIKLDNEGNPIYPINPEQMKRVSKFAFIPFIIVFALMIIFIIVMVFVGIKDQKVSNIKSFNSKYELNSGTKSCFLMSSTIDNIVTNNKKEAKHKITIKYNGKETTDPNEIISIKKEACPNNFKEYEISFDYDEEGYINVMNINEK